MLDGPAVTSTFAVRTQKLLSVNAEGKGQEKDSKGHSLTEEPPETSSVWGEMQII